jgi:O-antigen ligase
MLRPFDYLLAIAGMFYSLEGFSAVLAAPESLDLTGEAGSPALRAIGLVIGVATLVRLATLAGRLRPVVERAFPLFIPVAFAVLSFTWAGDPALSLRRSLALVLSTCCALFLVCRFDRKQIIDCLLVSLALYCVGSAALIVGAPSIGTHTAGDTRFAEHVGAWRGLSSFKNDFGRIVALAAVTFLTVAFMRQTRRWVFVLLTLFATVLALGSRSGQSIALMAGCALAVVYVMFVKDLPSNRRTAILLLTVPVLILGALAMDTVFAMALQALGKDATLTGRLSIWPVVLDAMHGHLTLGGGYGSGWQSLVNDHVGEALGRQIGHAHNGYLNLIVDLGVAGLAVTLAFIALVLACVYHSFTRGDHSEFVIFGIIVVIFVLAGNWVGSFLIKHNNIFWILLVCLFCKIVALPVPAAISGGYAISVPRPLARRHGRTGGFGHRARS